MCFKRLTLVGGNASSMTGIDIIRNSALVSADPEESFNSPGWSPRVGNNPIIGSVLASPSYDLDGMASELVTPGVLVDTAGVRHEILVYSESGLDWSVGHDVHLGVFDGVESSNVGSLVELLA